jgi:hypothetical protein
MINRKFFEMIDQHAPPGDCLQEALPASHVLSTNAHCNNGGIVFHRRKSVTMVRIELKTPLNKFARIHPIIPTFTLGGFKSSFICALNASKTYHLSTSATFLLYQFIKADVDKLKMRYIVIINATPSIDCPV